jgi:hypothetical protein
MPMLDKVLPALFIAAISALTFLAYKHPKGYQKISLAINVTYGVAVTSALTWHLGSYFTYEAIIPFLEASKIQEAKAVANSYLIPSWILFVGCATSAYMTFLLFLPKLLGDDKPIDK